MSAEPQIGLNFDLSPKPLAIGWVGGKDANNGIIINFSRRFSWLQRIMIRMFFGIEIVNVPAKNKEADI